MDVSKAMEQSQDSSRQSLDERYGKIGISAVAAAVCHKGEQRKSRKPRVADTVYDSD